MTSPSPLSRLTAPIKPMVVTACAIAAIGALAGIAPFIAVVEITRALLAGNTATAVTIAWLASGALALRLLCLLTSGALTHRADANLQLILRRDIAAHLSRTPLSWFTGRNSGTLKKIVQDDVGALHEIVGHAYTAIVGALVVPIAALVYLGITAPILLPAALLPVAIGIALYAAQMRGYGDKMARYEASLADVNAAAVEYVHGIAVIKTFSGPDQAFARFVKRTEAFISYFWNWISGLLKLAAATEIMLSPLLSVALAAGLALGLSAMGLVAPVEALALVVMAPALTAPFLTLAFSQNGIMQGRQAAERLIGLLDAPVLKTPRTPLTPADTRIALNGVTVSYDGEKDVLSDIDLTLEPGSMTALVGPSGSGKSTLARLLPRFIDPRKGEVCLGDVPLPMLAPETIYRHVGFVFQDVRLLRASLRDNIAIGAPDATMAEIARAARAARIHDRIAALPDGYDTILGTGVHLSGGEAQRITIARGLLANTPILVLDEALAFADAETGAALRAAITGWRGSKTVLAVAHDLTTVSHADQICVLDQGRMVERGTHAELLAQGGLYAALWSASRKEDAA